MSEVAERITGLNLVGGERREARGGATFESRRPPRAPNGGTRRGPRAARSSCARRRSWSGARRNWRG
jgi:hypothetical protein